MKFLEMEEKKPKLSLPRWRRRSGNTSKDTEKNSDSQTSTKDGTSANRIKENGTRFGAVKVLAAVLSQSVDNKTYVVTNKTTSKDLVSIVLAGYNILCEDNDLFYLSLESKRKDNKDTYDTTQSTVSLDPSALPLEVQSQYPRGEARFLIHTKPEAGIITVHDKCIHQELSTRSVFITASATCRSVIELFLEKHNPYGNFDDYGVFEVDANSKISHELRPCRHPLVIQKDWLDPYVNYFEIRLKNQSQDGSRLIRRSRSLEEVREHKKVLNIREIRKSLIPKRTPRRKPLCLHDNNAQTVINKDDHEEPGDNRMTRLRESLNQLQDHLVTIQNQQTKDFTILDGANSQGVQVQTGINSSSRVHVHNNSVNSSGSQRRARSLSRDKGTKENSAGSRTRTFVGDPESRGRQRRYSAQEITGHIDSESEKELNIINIKRGRPASGSAPTTPRGGRTSSDLNTSSDNLSAWERRKMYDMQRKLDKIENNLDMGSNCGETVKPRDSRISSASSTSSTKSRQRRSLPAVPGHHNNAAIEERKKRISQRAIEKISKGVHKTEMVFLDTSVISDTSSGLTDFESEYPAEGESINVDCIEESALRTESSASEKQVPKREMQFKPLDPQPPTDSVASEQLSNSASQDTLHKIIHDLKTAAAKSFDSIDSSINNSSSFSCAEKENTDQNSTKEPSGLNSYNIIDGYEQSLISSSTPIITEPAIPSTNTYYPNVPPGEYTHHPVLLPGEYTSQPMLPPSNYSRQNSISHNTLHKLLKTCELHFVTLRSINNCSPPPNSIALCLFETRSAVHNLDSNFNSTSFRPPSGIRPILGQIGSAFTPVMSNFNRTASFDGSLVHAYPTVDNVDRNHLMELEGNIMTGDYLIELNGVNVLNYPLIEVNAILDSSGGHMELVVARSKAQSPADSTRSTPDVQRQLDKSKLKYNSLKQETEKYRDLVAELKLELQSRDDAMYGLELELSETKTRLAAFNNKSTLAAEENCSKWNNNKTYHHQTLGTRRIGPPLTHTDDNPTPIRNIATNNYIPESSNSQYFDYDYEGTHVSAV